MPYQPPPQESDLHRAARTGDLSALERLFRQGIDIDEREDLEIDNGPHLRQLTPLMTAARSIDGATVETLQWLLDHGADLRAESEGGDSAAWYAAGMGGRWQFHEWRIVPDHVDRLQFLLDAGLDPRETNFIGRSLLTESCQAGDPARVKLLLGRGAVAVPTFNPQRAADLQKCDLRTMQKFFENQGADPATALQRAHRNVQPPATSLSSSEIPLMCAAESGSVECVRLILEAGADPNTRDKHGQTALSIAGSAAVVHELIGANANPNLRDEFGRDPLRAVLTGGICQGACGPARFEVAKALLDSGVSVERVPGDGNTRLYDAAFSQAADAVEFLLKHGANPLVTHSEGATPLHAICWQGEYADESTNEATVRIIDALFAAGIDPNVRDSLGETAMHEAASGDWGNQTAVRTLLKHGGEPDPVNNDGITPLMYAAENSEVDCIRLLLEAGADPIRTDRDGVSALDRAMGNSNREHDPEAHAQVLETIYGGTALPSELQEMMSYQDKEDDKARECIRLLMEAAGRIR